VPNQGRTPRRTIRIGDDLWGALRWVADTEGITVSELLRRLATQHIKDSVAVLDANLSAYGRRSSRRREP
jgi:predicted DNA-binding ribbon-helix-helix protein